MAGGGLCRRPQSGREGSGGEGGGSKEIYEDRDGGSDGENQTTNELE